MALGGIWETWHYEDVIRNTVAIITTDPNPRMAWIHNRPRASEGPRMPFILPKENERLWLDTAMSPSEVTRMIGPYPPELLKDHTVNRLRGKQAPGNVPDIMKPHDYQELTSQQGNLFLTLTGLVNYNSCYHQYWYLVPTIDTVKRKLPFQGYRLISSLWDWCLVSLCVTDILSRWDK